MSRQGSPSPYQWSSLPSPKLIRLLDVEPAPLHSQTSCSIRRPVFEECSGYEALSYVWGTAEKDHVLFYGNEYIRVAATVQSAIQTLRYPDWSRTPWIGSICMYLDRSWTTCCRNLSCGASGLHHCLVELRAKNDRTIMFLQDRIADRSL
jgi:hypothetical protein